MDKFILLVFLHPTSPVPLKSPSRKQATATHRDLEQSLEKIIEYAIQAIIFENQIPTRLFHICGTGKRAIIQHSTKFSSKILTFFLVDPGFTRVRSFLMLCLKFC